MKTGRQYIKIIIPCGVMLFLSFSSLGLSDENKNVTVDQAIGGMDEGRRVASQGRDSSKNITSTVENHGYLYSHTGPANGSQPSQESSGTAGSNNPIVTVEANPSSGTPSTVHVDAGVTGAATGSTGVQVGNATDITAQELAHEADITTKPVTGTTGQTIQEPSGTSGNPIVGVEAGIDQNSGIPSAGVSVDTTGELEDRQILQTDLMAEGLGSSETQTGSASSITGSQTVSGSDVTTQPVESVISAPSDLSAEVDTTGQTVGATTDVGEEADVSGTSDDDDDEKKDSADGIGISTGL